LLPLRRMWAICTLYCPLVKCHYGTSRFRRKCGPE
jgi:hypothetical protein